MSVTKDAKPRTLEERVAIAQVMLNELAPLVKEALEIHHTETPRLYREKLSTSRQYLKTWRKSMHMVRWAGRLSSNLNNYVAKLQKEVNK